MFALLLLLAEEEVTEEGREEGGEAAVGEEEVVRAREGAASLGRAAEGAELGEAQNVGNGECEVADLGAGSGGGEGGLGAVVDEEADGGVEGAGEGDAEGGGTTAVGDLLEREDQVNEVVVGFVVEAAVRVGGAEEPLEKGVHRAGDGVPPHPGSRGGPLL